MSHWWLEKPIRLIQTNLREIDADLDPDRLVSDLVDWGANTLLFNVGGIVANYPTQLPFHYRNPHLRSDLVGEVLRRCQAAGIRFIGRFDFSKVNERYYAAHPEWFYLSAAGKRVSFFGQMHTCVNGEYQKELSLLILDEVLSQYPLDGVFFNMFGYQTRDYSGAYHGICQCDNCRSAFYACSGGMELPRDENTPTPALAAYRRFQQDTVAERLNDIANLVKRFSAEIAVCTYHHHRVDIVRSESNSAVDRPLPHHLFSASEQTRLITSSWPDKVPSNSAVHFVDIPYRFVSVPPALTELRLAQNIASGGGSDYYVIGTLDRQPDRSAEQGARALFRYHARHEAAYTGVRPAARVALLRIGPAAEYRGLYRLLAEEHIPCDILHPAADVPLGKYDAVVLPGPVDLSAAAARRLDDYVQAGGRLLLTHSAKAQAACDPAAPPAAGWQPPLKCLGIERYLAERTDMRSAYLAVEPKAEWPTLADIDLLFLDSSFVYCQLAAGSRGLLKLVPPSMYGPPEKCYIEQVTDVPGLVVHKAGEGVAASVPWPLGTLYWRHSNDGHRRFFAAVFDQVLAVRRQVLTNASPMVEITLLGERAGADGQRLRRLLVHLVNTSGHAGTAYFAPVPMRDIRVSLAPEVMPAGERFCARCLTADTALELTVTPDGRYSFTLPELALLAAVEIAPV